MGYGLQARRILKPLIEGGADVKIIPDEDYLPEHMRLKDPYWTKLIEDSKNKPDTDIRICYCIPPRAKPQEKGVNILYAMWETDEYPRQWAKIINSGFNIFFAGCNSLIASAKKAEITVPIIAVNATLDCKEWNPVGNKMTINEIPNDHIKFLFIGNFIPRKNFEDLLLGFNVAFENVKDVSLIIKTWSNANDGNGKKHLIESFRHLNSKATGLHSKPKVILLSDILNEDQIINLIRGSDCYVSVSKGEGFDLPMIQSMALEKLILTTRFLAHGDYLNDSNSIDIKYTLAPCTDAAAPNYDSYQNWAKPDMQDYISKLKQAYTMIKEGKHTALGKAARETVVNNFSEEVNTDKIAHILRGIKIPEKINAKDQIKKMVL